LSRQSKAQPGPWRLTYTQMDSTGRVSRPRVVDALGEEIDFKKPANAALAALAPEMFACLSAAASDLYLLLALVKSEFPTFEPPPWAAEVERLVSRRRLAA
jgi:hypothetical protein